MFVCGSRGEIGTPNQVGSCGGVSVGTELLGVMQYGNFGAVGVYSVGPNVVVDVGVEAELDLTNGFCWCGLRLGFAG